jgi:hypothetical protein
MPLQFRSHTPLRAYSVDFPRVSLSLSYSSAYQKAKNQPEGDGFDGLVLKEIKS